MKHNSLFTAPFTPAPEAPDGKAELPMRGRNAKMDLFLRKVTGSARYVATAIEATMAAPAKRGNTLG